MLALKVVIGFVLLVAVATVAGLTCGVCGEAADVAQEQFGPRALLKKYEFFKDEASALDAKRASLDLLADKGERLRAEYEDVPRERWPRDVRETLSLWDSELTGVKASYNTLAASYNAQMAKFNWQFANTGTLPAGASDPLPREFAPYLTK